MKRTNLLLIGALVVAVIVTLGVRIWQESRHRFEVSCDKRLDPRSPYNECTDYYGDYGEVSCVSGTMKYTRCDRTGALGGCHDKSSITWHYGGGDGGDTWSGSCLGSDKRVGADWTEPEE